MENIIVTSCMDCPFYSDDSDYGPSCYHGVDVSYNLKKEDELHYINKHIHSSIPKKCPLLTGAITTVISEIYNDFKTK